MTTKQLWRKVQILTILLFFSSSLFSQNAQIDSLKKVFITARDTAKVNALNELSNLLIDNYSDSALKYTNMALKEAEKLDYTEGVSKALTNKATLHFYRTEWNKWEIELKKLIDLKTKHKITDGLADNYIYLGMSLQGQCKNEEALKTLKKQNY